ADALELLRTPLHGRFDLVFLDPPFDAGLWGPALELLGPWLADDAWLYLETPPGPRPPPAGWAPHRESAARDAHHALLRRAGGGRRQRARPGTASPPPATRVARCCAAPTAPDPAGAAAATLRRNSAPTPLPPGKDTARSRIAVYPGTCDPITNCHADLVDRAA